MQPKDLPARKFEKLSLAAIDFWVLGNPPLPEDEEEMTEEQFDQVTRERFAAYFGPDGNKSPAPCACEQWRKIRDDILAEK